VNTKSFGLLAVGVLAVTVAGAAALVVGNFGKQPSAVDVERNPIPPERPSNLTGDAVRGYVSDYEKRRLYNDILAAHSHRLRMNERVISVCRPRSVTEAAVGTFEVELRCAGGIDNRADTSRQERFQYRVTYRVTAAATEQIAIQRYPYDHRDTLMEPDRNRSSRDSA
jgi:hypothetical protein